MANSESIKSTLFHLRKGKGKEGSEGWAPEWSLLRENPAGKEAKVCRWSHQAQGFSGEEHQTGLSHTDLLNQGVVGPRGVQKQKAHRRGAKLCWEQENQPTRDLVGSAPTQLSHPFTRPFTCRNPVLSRPTCNANTSGQSSGPREKPYWDPQGSMAEGDSAPETAVASPSRGTHTINLASGLGGGNSTDESWQLRSFSGPPWEPTERWCVSPEAWAAARFSCEMRPMHEFWWSLRMSHQFARWSIRRW